MKHCYGLAFDLPNGWFLPVLQVVILLLVNEVLAVEEVGSVLELARFMQVKCSRGHTGMSRLELKMCVCDDTAFNLIAIYFTCKVHADIS